MRKLLLLASCVLAIVVACGGGSSSVDPEKYDRSCQNANDCVTVATDACCGCPTAAINVDAEAQYAADIAAAKKNCGDISCPNIACQPVAAGCSAGLCVVTAPVLDAGDQ